MKKDIKWLKREIRKELESWQGVEGGIDGDGINEITLLINQLDEPEVTLDRAFEKVAESYLMKKEEIWRHLEWLEARGGNVTYGEPEVLSQEWIDENVVEGDFRGGQEFWYGRFIEEEKVRNLLMPKREKPVIPKFVAEYIEQSKKDNDSINQVFAFMDDKEDKDLWHWLFPSMYEEKRANQEVFMRAWLDGYEVEKEKLYHVVNKENYFMLRKYDGLVDILHVSSSMSREKHGKDTRFMLTEKEIKDYDERYIPFMVPVDEVNND